MRIVSNCKYTSLIIQQEFFNYNKHTALVIHRELLIITSIPGQYELNKSAQISNNSIWHIL